MDRLDKIVSSQGKFSRSDVKKLASSGKITVDDIVIKKSDYKVDINKSIIRINGKILDYKKDLYLVLNKPKGFVSATRDNNDRTVLDLVPDSLYRDDLFPAGRLDKDTTGLMIITTDGNFAHEILSPNKHVKKTYEVTIDIPVTNDMKNGFKEGIKLNDGECKEADLDITGEYTCNVTLREGRYHQIKRMFGCYKATVIELNRIKIGNFDLPSDLKQGKCRELTNKEIELLKKR